MYQYITKIIIKYIVLVQMSPELILYVPQKERLILKINYYVTIFLLSLKKMIICICGIGD